MSYYFHENVSYIERKENNLKLCSNQDLFIAFAIGKNRNNSKNKQLSNLKETEMETEEKHTTLSVITTIRTSLILPIRSMLW